MPPTGGTKMTQITVNCAELWFSIPTWEMKRFMLTITLSSLNTSPRWCRSQLSIVPCFLQTSLQQLHSVHNSDIFFPIVTARYLLFCWMKVIFWRTPWQLERYQYAMLLHTGTIWALSLIIVANLCPPRSFIDWLGLCSLSPCFGTSRWYWEQTSCFRIIGTYQMNWQSLYCPLTVQQIRSLRVMYCAPDSVLQQSMQ